MTVKQISVFLENKSGTLITVLDLLKKEQIQIVASTIADTAEYGIFRMICSDPVRAFDAMKNAGLAVSLCDVFAIDLEDKPGCAADVIGVFASKGVGIAYLYSFLFGGKGVLIFKTDDIAKGEAIISEKGYTSALV